MRHWPLALLIAVAETVAAQVPVVFVTPSGERYGELGHELAYTANYVVDYLNDRGARPSIELTVVEDGCDAERARNIATALVGAGWEGVEPAVVFGHCPDVAGEVAPIYAAAGSPFFMPLAPGSDEISRYGASVFQVEPGGRLMAELVARVLKADPAERDRLEGAQVSVLTDETAYTRNFAEALAYELRSIVGRMSVASAADELADSRVVFYSGADRKAHAELLELSATTGTRLVLVRRGITTEREWMRLMDEVEGRELDVRTVMPAPPARERHEWFFFDTTAQLVLASFQLATQALQASGGASGDVPRQMRLRRNSTILGSLQSAETGAIGPLQAEIVTAREWLVSSRYYALPTAGIDPPPPPPPGSPPVYNLEIEPLLEPSPIVLQPDTETELRFFIGGSTETNVLGEAVINLDEIERLAGGERLELSVTLNCLVCATENYQRRSLTYEPGEGRSIDTAAFTIIPKRERADADTGAGLLLFAVDARGVDLDVIQVPVFVGPPAPAQRAAYEAPAVRAIHHGQIAELESPDLVLDITDAPVALDVTLIPELPALAAALRAALGGSGRDEWQFRAGASKADLDDLVRSAYLELRAMINQNEEILQSVYEAQGAGVVLTPGGANLDFEDSDRDAMLGTLRRHGARLYQRLFSDAEPELRLAMRVLEDFRPADGRPLSVRIRASNVYAPWQLLYARPRGEVVAEDFWGLRYALGIVQWTHAAPVSFAGVMDPPDADETLFAAYRGPPGSSDEVAERARLLARHVAGKLGAAELDLAESREDFLARLENEGRALRLLVAYGHASSGTCICAAADGGAVVYDEVSGVRFMLAANEAIVPGDIDDRRPDPDEGLLLASQPIVIFNACETGAGGARPANNNGFIGALTRAGARAVIVTETPVWNNFAFHFGTHVIDGLFQGKRADVALRDARLRHLNDWNNPLGLVYTLYGNPAARIALPGGDP